MRLLETHEDKPQKAKLRQHVVTSEPHTTSYITCPIGPDACGTAHFHAFFWQT